MSELTTITSSPEQLASEIRINGLLSEVGLPPETIASHIKERLVLLEELTPTIEDEKAAIAMASAVFETAAAAHHPYSEEEQRTVIVGTLFTDIGKSGPRQATPEQSRLIASMFSVENLPPEEVNGSISDFLRCHAAAQAETAAGQLAGLGLDVHNQTMRDLYDAHTKWTLEILIGDGVPKEAIPAAAAHHHMRGDNPDAILDKHDEFNHHYDFGHNRSYDRPEKLISVLDMYDAFRRRSRLDHDVAMEHLRTWIGTASNGRYANDSELAEILDDLDTTMLAPAAA